MRKEKKCIIQKFTHMWRRWGAPQIFVLAFIGELEKQINIKKTVEKNWKICLEILSFYTYMCTINEGHMIHGSWNIRCDRQKLLLFWVIFRPFSPQRTRKIKILKLKETPGDIIILLILHISTINYNHMMYGSWNMVHDR